MFCSTFKCFVIFVGPSVKRPCGAPPLDFAQGKLGGALPIRVIRAIRGEFIVARVHGCFSSQSFWKAGSERKGSQSGSSLRRAGVIGVRL